MWPQVGPIPMFSIFYSVGILSHYLISCLLAGRLGLRHRVWIAVSLCYNFGMIVGAKALYDLQHTQFDFRALLSINHYMKGGLWGGLLAYLCLSVPLVLVLSKHRQATLDLIALSIPIPWVFAKLGCLFNGRRFDSLAVPTPEFIPAEKVGKNPSTPLRMKIFFMPSEDEALTAIGPPVTLLAYTSFFRRTG